jgi:hypothetical protein
MKNIYNILFGQPEGLKPLEKRRSRLTDNIISGINIESFEDVELIHLAQEMDQQQAVLKMAMKFWFHIRRQCSDQLSYY